MIDELLYSAICLGAGAEGDGELFVAPEGAKIPFLGTGRRREHQKVFSKLTTNLYNKAGEGGSAVGDIRIYGVRVKREANWGKPPRLNGRLHLLLNGVQVVALPLDQCCFETSGLLGTGFVGFGNSCAQVHVHDTDVFSVTMRVRSLPKDIHPFLVWVELLAARVEAK